MFFDHKEKLNFGPEQQDPDIFADKLQAIANFACGSFETNVFEENNNEKVIWRLSDYYKKTPLAFNVKSKIVKAFKSLEKRKEDKLVILERIAMKYKIDPEEDLADVDSQYSSDLYMNTEEDFNLLDDDTMILDKDRNYFGKKAKDRFWTLYKSDRTFKDNMKSEVKDPRFAYIKSCHEMGMLPKASMVIRTEKTTHLSFANQGLLQKNSKAVAESLKRYSLDVEALDFTGNGIKAKEWVMLVDAIEGHCSTLLELNFSHNKIGDEGALALSEKLVKMKGLEVLNLDGNLLGDEAITEIVRSVNTIANLRILNLSNNALGNKTNESPLVDQLIILLKSSGTLTELDLSWNNFRGAAAEDLLLGLKENYTIKKLNLSFNLFGVPMPGGSASIVKLAEVLQDNTVLEEVDISSNLIDAKSAFCLAHGLRINTTLKSFIINGNPIGSSGIKFLLQSLNDNENGKVEDIKLKETEIIVESKKLQNFDPMNVERSYTLMLDDIYDRVVLYHLLDIDEKIVQNSLEEEGIQQGDWFIDAKIAGSAWTPPKEKDKDGKWNIGPDAKDKLTFSFLLDPKRNPKLNIKEPYPTGTIVDSKNLLKPLIQDQNLEKNVDLLIRLLIEGNVSCQRELIETMWQEYSFTYIQANELLQSVDNEIKVYAWVHLFNRIVNRHFRFDILQWLPNIDTKQMTQKILGEAYKFTYFNPTGHYRLKLSNSSDREVAMTLLMLNRKYKLLVNQGVVTDHSKVGNQSWFRNEKISGMNFSYSEDFTLPSYGVLECDFIYLINPPHKDQQTLEEKQDMIKNLLLALEGKIEEQIAVFRAMSEYIVLSSEQLAEFIDLIDNPSWKTEWYIAGVGRIYDIRNYDFIK